jgi:hypothetical protein
MAVFFVMSLLNVFYAMPEGKYAFFGERRL